MMICGRILLLPIGFLFISASQLGCEDAAATRRAESHRAIQEASLTFQEASVAPLLPGNEHIDDARQKLNQVIQKMAAAKSGDSGQDAAASMLAADAHHSLARLDLSQAEVIELDHHSLRILTHTLIDSATRLDALANAVASTTTEDERAMLAQALADARQQIEESSNQLAQVQEPIARHESQIAQDQAAATNLEDQAARLRQEHRRLGPADGFPNLEEAVRLEDQANQHKLQIAHTESLLEIELYAERDLVQSKLNEVESIATSVNETTASLQSLDNEINANVAETRAVVDENRNAISAALQRIEADHSGELGELYDSAIDHLEQAASMLQKAASGAGRGGSDSPRLALARVNSDLAELHWLRTRSLTDLVALIERAAAHSNLLGGNYQSQLQNARTSLQEAKSSADAAFQAAQDAAQQVQSSNPAVQRVRQSLIAAQAALNGRKVELKLDAPAASGDMAPAGMTGRSGQAGFASPEEAVAAFSAGEDLDASQRILNAVQTNTPAQREFIQAQIATTRASQDFINALQSQFGADQLGMIGEMMQSMQSMGAAQSATLESSTSDRATIALDSMMGQFRIEIVKVENGSWMIPWTSMESMLMGMDVQQITTSMQQMTRMYQDFAQRVRAGEFATADEVMMKFTEEQMNSSGFPGG